MSVPEGLRKCGKLKVLVEALDLTDYTLTITANSKVFVPEYKSVLTDKINELVLNIYINLFTANNIVVKSEMDARERHQLQMVAITQCNDLLALIQIAQKVFHLKLKRIKYWGSKIISVKSLIKSWARADVERYSAGQF